MNTKLIQKPLVYFKDHRLQRYLVIGFLSVVILFSFVLASFDYFLHSPADEDGVATLFTIESGQGVRTISANLSKEGIIKNDLIYLVYLKTVGLSGLIQAGDYSLSSSMSPLEITDLLTKGEVASHKITIPEGWTIERIADYLDNEGLVNKDDFILAANQSYDYEFLADKPTDLSLEGFLFPDTYQVSVTVDAEGIVRMMLDNFDRRITQSMRSLAEDSGLGLYKTVTLASIVEKEADKPTDRKVVAGIFLSRLREGMRLQSDVTVAYALGEDKEDLTIADIDLDSPYNTYKVDGLPAGPICNPGLESINAVLYPEYTDFRYFIAAKSQMYYAKTIEEHNAYVAKYLN